MLMIVSALSVVSISAADSTIISSLSAIVTEPVAGKLPNYEVENTVTDASLRQVFWWEKDEDGSYTEVALDETFVAGKIYSCDIGYQVNGEGILFADDITGTVNGKEASVFLNETKTSATLMIEFVCAETQPELSVIFTKDSKAKCGSSLTVDIEAMAERTDKLSVVIADKAEAEQFRPCVRICYEDGTETGLAFHGVPGGHEFTSFVLGMYNAAGPGQSIDEREKSDIAGLTKPMDMQILVTLSCTMCPELVTAAQRIAVEKSNVTAEVYDVNLFTQLREKYHVMSVPCLVIDGETVAFGKKNLRQLLDIIK